MSIELLRPPRLEGTPEQQNRVLQTWLNLLHERLGALDIENRLARAESVLIAIADLGQLSQSISNPPTQAEVEAVQDKVNEIIVAAALPALA